MGLGRCVAGQFFVRKRFYHRSTKIFGEYNIFFKNCGILQHFLLARFITHTHIYRLVQPDADFECLGVIMEHSQDVKCVAWHPTEEVVLHP